MFFADYFRKLPLGSILNGQFLLTQDCCHKHWNSQKCFKVMIIKVFHCPKCCWLQLYLSDYFRRGLLTKNKNYNLKCILLHFQPFYQMFFLPDEGGKQYCFIKNQLFSDLCVKASSHFDFNLFVFEIWSPILFESISCHRDRLVLCG